MTKTPYLPPTGWVRQNVVLAHVPFGTTKLNEEIAAGRFPAPRHFGPRILAWDSAAVHRWIKEQR
jgi:prophage regulatory protein